MRFAIAALVLSVTAALTVAQAQQAGHHVETTKQISNRATRNANQALDKTTALSALPPQPLVPGADATVPGLNNPGVYDNPSLTNPSVANPGLANPPVVNSQPYDPGSIHYPYGRTSLGTIDPASRANPYGPYSSGDSYGHYGPNVLPNTQFGNPAPAFGAPASGVNNTPAFSRGR